MKIRNYLFLMLMGLLVLGACKKEDPFVNPYDDPSLDPPDEEIEVVEMDPQGIAGIHRDIFKPTCSNSGCHDGTFLPDFRTVESTYSTLIYQTPIKNDTGGSYLYRVQPGNADASVLYQRLIVDIDGQSGIMPLAVDPESDWNANRQTHIANIKAWIDNGAKDMFGNTPAIGDLQPQLAGVVGYANGDTNNTLPRRPGKGPIKVPPGTGQLDLWFALEDVESSPQSFTYNKIKFGDHLNGYEDYPEENLNIVQPILRDGYLGDPVQYFHKITINPSNYSSGEVVFFRIYVQDGGADLTELPSDGGETYIKEYAAFVIE